MRTKTTIGYIVLKILEFVSLVFMKKKDVVIIIGHEMPCNVPGIRTTTINSKGYVCHTEIKLQCMGDNPNRAVRKFPDEEVAAKDAALKYKTRTW